MVRVVKRGVYCATAKNLLRGTDESLISYGATPPARIFARWDETVFENLRQMT